MLKVVENYKDTNRKGSDLIWILNSEEKTITISTHFFSLINEWYKFYLFWGVSCHFWVIVEFIAAVLLVKLSSQYNLILWSFVIC